MNVTWRQKKLKYSVTSAHLLKTGNFWFRSVRIIKEKVSIVALIKSRIIKVYQLKNNHASITQTHNIGTDEVILFLSGTKFGSMPS